MDLADDRPRGPTRGPARAAENVPWGDTVSLLLLLLLLLLLYYH